MTKPKKDFKDERRALKAIEYHSLKEPHVI